MGKKLKRGRPVKFRSEFSELARKYCLLGATDEDLARFFQVETRTIERWRASYPDFCRAIKEGREIADAHVGERLYERAMGFEHDDEEIKVVDKGVVRVPVRKIYPPDTAACIFWLKNRQRGKWRDKIEQEITGKDGGPVQVAVALPGLEDRIALIVKKDGE